MDYRGFKVSDRIVREKLEEIADLFGRRLWVTSGDRTGTGPSHVSLQLSPLQRDQQSGVGIEMKL